MTMTIQDLGALGELLGSIAVLVTLIYLALQTRQNTLAIGAQLDAAAISQTQNIAVSAATSKELGEAIQQDSPFDITTHQIQLAQYWLAVLTSYQWQFRQARRGLMPTFREAEKGLGASVSSMFINSRSLPSLWEPMRAGFSSEFVEWVEQQRSKAA